MTDRRDNYRELLRRIGRSDDIAYAEQLLPSDDDRDRDRELLERPRLDDGEVTEEFGSSP